LLGRYFAGVPLEPRAIRGLLLGTESCRPDVATGEGVVGCAKLAPAGIMPSVISLFVLVLAGGFAWLMHASPAR
jgi:hypothetical protein